MQQVKQRYVVKLVLLGLTVAVLAAVSPSVSAQTNGRSGRKLQQVQQAMSAGAALRPDPATDEIAEVWFGADGTGRGIRVTRKIEKTGIRENRRTFWIVDPVSATYRAFWVTDPASDAIRIGQHLQRFGVSVKTEQLVEQLRKSIERSETRRQQIDRTPALRPPSQARRPTRPVAVIARNGGPIALGAEAEDGLLLAQGGYCTFNVIQSVQAWEPGAYVGFNHLTETTAGTTVQSGWGTWFIWNGGDCWANPFTFVATAWYVVYCGEDEYAVTDPEAGIQFTNNRWGEYVNWDFGWDGWSTSIWQQAAVMLNSSGLSNTVYQWVGGEASSLIFMQDYYDYASNGGCGELDW